MARPLRQPTQPRLIELMGALQWGCSPLPGPWAASRAEPEFKLLDQPGAKSGDIYVAALARMELLFRWWTLRTAFAAWSALAIRTTLTARAAGANTTWPTASWATWAPRWPHLFQLR
jgi:hypothetical protein